MAWEARAKAIRHRHKPRKPKTIRVVPTSP
jgi:hypothetical protein